jgi:hypothetical protein
MRPEVFASLTPEKVRRLVQNRRSVMLESHTRTSGSATPLEIVGYGAAAGLAGALVLTVLARITPGLKPEPKRRDEQPQNFPADSFDEKKVIEWQDRSRSPAAYLTRRGGEQVPGEHAAAVTPAGALAEAQGPGPEGAAEQFIAKLGSGLFDRDLSEYSKPAGKAVHFAYGGFWGSVYGILQGRRRRKVWLAGTAHGLFVWALGPGCLVPAMRLMLPPSKAPRRETIPMVAAHIVYGLTVAKLFDTQLQKNR